MPPCPSTKVDGNGWNYGSAGERPRAAHRLEGLSRAVADIPPARFGAYTCEGVCAHAETGRWTSLFLKVGRRKSKTIFSVSLCSTVSCPVYSFSPEHKDGGSLWLQSWHLGARCCGVIELQPQPL